MIRRITFVTEQPGAARGLWRRAAAPDRGGVSRRSVLSRSNDRKVFTPTDRKHVTWRNASMPVRRYRFSRPARTALGVPRSRPSRRPSVLLCAATRKREQKPGGAPKRQTANAGKLNISLSSGQNCRRKANRKRPSRAHRMRQALSCRRRPRNRGWRRHQAPCQHRAAMPLESSRKAPQDIDSIREELQRRNDDAGD